MLDSLKKKMKEEREESIATEVKENLNVFPETWEVKERKPFRHPNIEKDVEVEELKEWFQREFKFTPITPYTALDEILTGLNMPEDVRFKKSEFIILGLLILEVGETKYKYTIGKELGLSGKETSLYDYRIKNDRIICFIEGQPIRIYIWKPKEEYREEWTKKEITNIEAIIQKIWEQEGKWNIFTIHETLYANLGKNYRIALGNKDGLVESYDAKGYYNNGTYFSIENEKNWKAKQGLRFVRCKNGKCEHSIGIGEHYLEVDSQIVEEQVVEDYIYKKRQSKRYKIESPILDDVCNVKNKRMVTCFEEQEEMDIVSFLEIAKLLPEDFLAFLEKIGMQKIVMKKLDDTTLVFQSKKNGKQIFLSAKENGNILLKIPTPLTTVEYRVENGKLQMESIQVGNGELKIESTQVVVHLLEPTLLRYVTFYKRTFKGDIGYSLQVCEEKRNVEIQNLFLSLQNEGRDQIKSILEAVASMTHNGIEMIQYIGEEEIYRILFGKECNETSIQTFGEEITFYQYPNGEWKLEMLYPLNNRITDFQKSSISSDGSYVYNKTTTLLKKEEVELLYETVIVPNFLILHVNL